MKAAWAVLGSPDAPPLAVDVVELANAPPAARPPRLPAPLPGATPVLDASEPAAALLKPDSSVDALLLLPCPLAAVPPTAEEPDVPPLLVTAGSEKPALDPLVLLPLYAMLRCSVMCCPPPLPSLLLLLRWVRKRARCNTVRKSPQGSRGT